MFTPKNLCQPKCIYESSSVDSSSHVLGSGCDEAEISEGKCFSLKEGEVFSECGLW